MAAILAAIVLATVISASLPLFKEIGLMFAAAIAVVIAVDQLLVKHLGGRSSWRMLLAAAMPFVAAFWGTPRARMDVGSNS